MYFPIGHKKSGLENYKGFYSQRPDFIMFKDHLSCDIYARKDERNW